MVENSAIFKIRLETDEMKWDRIIKEKLNGTYLKPKIK